MQQILAICEREDVDRIQLNAHNLAPENLGPARREIPFWVEDQGFELGISFTSTGMLPAPGMATCNSDQILDLEPSEDALFRGVDDKSGRWAIRKAQSLGLRFETARDQSGVDVLYALAQLSTLRTREGLPAEGLLRGDLEGARAGRPLRR